MSPNPNLPYTPFPERPGRQPVGAVEPVGAAPGWDPDMVPPSEGRIVRTRHLPREEALRELQEWRVSGATPMDAPPGTSALQRKRPDTATAIPRRQRIAVGPGDPATVLNWSVLEPVGRDDEGVWRHQLGTLSHDPPPAPPPSRTPPPTGWTA